MSYLSKIVALNNGDTEGFLPFVIGGRHVGNIAPAFAARLKAFPRQFIVTDQMVVLNPEVHDFDARSAALAEVLAALHRDGVVAQLLGELYPVTDGRREHALCLIDRGVIGYFGIAAYGQHLNGYVGAGERMKMWIGTRARDRHLYPGKLDQLVAGGLPWGISLADNLAKECQEEAGMSAELAAGATPVGAITYFAETPRGLKPDILYCYDLGLSADFQPVCTDGEVESFELMPIQEVIERVRDTRDFKPNCDLVIIDFLIRHGFIGPDDPDYLAIQAGLHAGVKGIGAMLL